MVEEDPAQTLVWDAEDDELDGADGEALDEGDFDPSAFAVCFEGEADDEDEDSDVDEAFDEAALASCDADDEDESRA